MFIVASFSVVGGLGTSMDTLMGNFSQELHLITLPGESGLEYFLPSQLSTVEGKSAFGVFAEVVAAPADVEIAVFSLADPHHVLPETLSTSGNNALAGVDSSLFGNITLAGQSVAIVGKYSSSIFPSDWLLVSLELAQTIASEAGKFNFVISSSLEQAEISALGSQGFVVQGMIGIVPFLDSSVREIESDAYLAIVPSTVAIAILAYSFIGAETADRRHDIGIIKTIGAGRRRVLYYLTANALIISAWGGLLGLALGTVLSYGVATAASSMFTSVFVVETSELLLLLSFTATLFAGLVGALLPALKMTLSSPVEDLKEVAPFS